MFAKLKNLFGDKAFNKLLIAIAVPIVIQNGVTNLVNLLDNIMIGQVGTEEMSSVAIVNQLFFVFNICIFGGISGAGIFTAQFFGHGDTDNMRSTVRYKIWISLIVTVLFIGAFLLFGEKLISLYITEDGKTDPIKTMALAKDYLKVAVIQMPFFAISQIYAGTLRESGETKVPMIASVCALLVNLVGNYILIFGHFGAPALGVVGAAVATVCSRVVEAAVVIVYTHVKQDRHQAFKGLYRSLRVPKGLLKNILKKGLPILANEAFWSAGVALLAQSYSLRGLDVVAAYNINATITNLFSVVLLAMGSSVSIILGNYLGSGRNEEAIKIQGKLSAISVIASTILAIVLALTSGLFPLMYNTTDEVRKIASAFMVIYAVSMPLNAYVCSAYFTLRAGGKTIITMLFDSGYQCLICLPVSFLFVLLTDMSAAMVYAIVQALLIFKTIGGAVLIKKRIWIHNLTELK